MTKPKVKKEKEKRIEDAKKTVEVTLNWLKAITEENEHSRSLINGTRIIKHDGTIVQLKYDPPMQLSVFNFAFTDQYFVYRPEYPSYRYLRYIPMRNISYIDIQFADIEEKKSEDADELALAT